LAKISLGLQGHKNPTPEQISAETKKLAVHYEAVGKKWISSSPDTLFVIAAGNDGADNDAFPTFPANIRIQNAITVAASNGNNSLAGFSNYGTLSVDLAAPGVAIVSQSTGFCVRAVCLVSEPSSTANTLENGFDFSSKDP
jgi:hypothetical protein